MKSSKNTSLYTCKECHLPQFPFSALSTSSNPWGFYAKDSGNSGGFSWATFSSKEQILHIGTNRLQVTQGVRLTSSANNAVSGLSSQWAIIHSKTLTLLGVSKVLDWSELIKPHKPPEGRENLGRKRGGRMMGKCYLILRWTSPRVSYLQHAGSSFLTRDGTQAPWECAVLTAGPPGKSLDELESYRPISFCCFQFRVLPIFHN